jgi:hypothetical protein
MPYLFGLVGWKEEGPVVTHHKKLLLRDLSIYDCIFTHGCGSR